MCEEVGVPSHLSVSVYNKTTKHSMKRSTVNACNATSCQLHVVQPMLHYLECAGRLKLMSLPLVTGGTLFWFSLCMVQLPTVRFIFVCLLPAGDVKRTTNVKERSS